MTLHDSTAYSATESVDDEELPYDIEQAPMQKRWQSNEYEVLFDGFPSVDPSEPFYPSEDDIYSFSRGTLTIKKKNKVIYEEFFEEDPGWLFFRNQDTNPLEDITGDGNPDLVIYKVNGWNESVDIYSLGDKVRKVADSIIGVSERNVVDLDNNLGLEIQACTHHNYGPSNVTLMCAYYIMRYDGKQYVLAPDLMKKPPLTKEELEGKIAEIKAEIGKPVQYMDSTTCAPCSKEVGSFKYSDYIINDNIAAERYLINIGETIIDLIYSGNYFQAVQIIDATWPGTKEEKEAFLKDLKRDIRKDLWEMNGIK